MVEGGEAESCERELRLRFRCGQVAANGLSLRVPGGGRQGKGRRSRDERASPSTILAGRSFRSVLLEGQVREARGFQLNLEAAFHWCTSPRILVDGYMASIPRPHSQRMFYNAQAPSRLTRESLSVLPNLESKLNARQKKYSFW